MSAKALAEILGVSKRQVDNWIAGKNTPPGFPGMQSWTALEIFINQRQKDQQAKEIARAMNKAAPGAKGDVADSATQSDFDET